MVIFQYKEGRLRERDSLLEALPFSKSKYPGERPVVSVVGAGGKTSMIREMAREYAAGGGRVIVTTTTHMMKEDLPWFLTEPSEERMDGLMKRYGQVWIGLPSGHGKIQSLPPEFLPCIWRRNVPVLIEADGARRLPLKVPAGHEPVILPETTHVLSVYGLDALGKRLDEACFRPELAEIMLGKERTQQVTEEDIAALASSEKAGRKGCPGDAGYTVVLNKADSKRLKRSAFAICRMLERRGIRDVIISAKDGPDPEPESAHGSRISSAEERRTGRSMDR